MKHLADANVVFPLLLSRHPHRQAALTWLQPIKAGQAGLCRLVQLTVLRLLCNRTVMGPDVQRPTDAWRALRALQLDERFAFAPEPENIFALDEPNPETNIRNTKNVQRYFSYSQAGE